MRKWAKLGLSIVSSSLGRTVWPDGVMIFALICWEPIVSRGLATIASSPLLESLSFARVSRFDWVSRAKPTMNWSGCFWAEHLATRSGVGFRFMVRLASVRGIFSLVVEAGW